ncbi:unnamed protein product [Darwinula stevensoni]|uniref:Uncharacterized protein n=1 Tax=Darwinula stevensoni TaxID=69355 RepID=A0A7R9A9W1_9CRUS|nr:unnamed protein product [Darwinula stevensoni]CAG0897797.1 unnamed protein product [Darwinula stevensoni]
MASFQGRLEYVVETDGGSPDARMNEIEVLGVSQRPTSVILNDSEDLVFEYDENIEQLLITLDVSIKSSFTVSIS